MVRLHLLMQRVWVRSLVAERRSHVPGDPKNQNIKQKQCCNQLNFKNGSHTKPVKDEKHVDYFFLKEKKAAIQIIGQAEGVTPCWDMAGGTESGTAKGSYFCGHWKLGQYCFAHFVPESSSQTLFWVEDRNLSNTTQINLSQC